MKKQLRKINFMGLTGLLVYVSFISWRLFFFAYTDNYRSQLNRIRYNLVPFKTIANYIRNSGSVDFDVLIYNLAGNVVAFMPLGFFLPFAFRGIGALKTFFLSFAFIVCAELMQLVSRRGVFDVDDVLLNMIGSMIGCGIYKLLFYIFAGRR
jgi:glycopeptide antibiotics resistance protein